MLLLPLLLSAFVVADSVDVRKRRLGEFSNRARLGAPSAVATANPRLAWIVSTHGEEVARNLLVMLRIQGLSLEGPDGLRVGRILPWLAREQSAKRIPYSMVNVPVEDLLLYAEAEAVDLNQLGYGQVLLSLSSFLSSIDRRLVEATRQDRVNFEDPATLDRLGVIHAWARARIALGDAGVFPNLIWLSDWARAIGLSLSVIREYSIDRATEASVAWHGEPVSDLEAWRAWKKRVAGFRRQGWIPRPGRVIRTWPSGFTLQAIGEGPGGRDSLTDESEVMDHCVGRRQYGDAYTANIKDKKSWIWSLRLPDGYSVLTMEVARSSRDEDAVPIEFRQVYGPNNKPIHPAFRAMTWDIVFPYFSSIPSYLQEVLASQFCQRGLDSWGWVLSQPSLCVRVGRTEGPKDDTREGASNVAVFAVQYAREIDKGPHPVTRAGACLSPEEACNYARAIDNGPTEETFLAACRSTETAIKFSRAWPLFAPRVREALFATASSMEIFYWARDEEKKASSETRSIALEDPWSALCYAMHFDREIPPFGGPSQPMVRADVERAVLGDPVAALIYDRDVRKGPSEAGRRAASKVIQVALAYAIEVDLKPHPVTLAGVLSGEDGNRSGLLHPESASLTRRYSRGYYGHSDEPSYLRVDGMVSTTRTQYLSMEVNARQPVSTALLDAVVEGALDPRCDPSSIASVAWMVPSVFADPSWQRALLVPSVVASLANEQERVARLVDSSSLGTKYAFFWSEFSKIVSRFRARKSLLLSSHRSNIACTFARHLDHGWRADTWAAVRGDRYQVDRYLAALNMSLATLPTDVRRDVAAVGIDLTSKLGWKSVGWTAGRSSSWGRRGERSVDRVDPVLNAHIVALVEGMASILRPIFEAKGKVSLAGYLAAEEDARGWASTSWGGTGASLSEPPGVFMAYARRISPNFLGWLYPDGWGRGAPEPAEPLFSAMKEDEAKIARECTAYFPVVSRFGEGDSTFVPPWGEPGQRPFSNFISGIPLGVYLRGGAEFDSLGAEDSVAASEVHGWFDTLSKTEKARVRRRLGLDKGVMPDFGKDLAVAFFAATPYDADRAWGTPVISKIQLFKTPLLHLFSWNGPRGSTGWIGVFPAPASPRSSRPEGIFAAEAREATLHRSAASSFHIYHSRG